MSILDYVFTAEEKERQALSVFDETERQKILFQYIVDESKLFVEAFNKVDIPAQKLSNMYGLAWRVKCPEDGWIITRRNNKLTYIGVSGTPYAIYLKNGKIKSFDITSYGDIAQSLLSPAIELDNPLSSIKLRESDGEVFVGFRTVPVASDMASFINTYNPNKPREFILTFK